MRIIENNFKENKLLYGSGDLGEAYAISLAQTLGAFALVTDDTKQGGPYMSLLQFEDEVMPFTFADVLILRFLMGITDALQTVKDFEVTSILFIGSVTVTLHVPVCPALVTFIVAVPALTPVTSPLAFTVATAVFDDSYVVAPASWSPTSAPGYPTSTERNR